MELSKENQQKLALVSALVDLMVEKGLKHVSIGDVGLTMRDAQPQPVVIPADGKASEIPFPSSAPDPLNDPVTFGSNGVPTFRDRSE